MEKKKLIKEIEEYTDKHMAVVEETGRFLWNNPEIANREFKGSSFLSKKYEENGFRVFRGVGGFPTSFMARFTNGKPNIKIGIFSDFDALPGLSSVKEGDPGHGCSHNLYAATALGTAFVLKEMMTKYNIDGEVTVIGAPAEEDGGSKQYFVDQGLLDGFDAFFGMHPVSHVNGVMFRRHISSAEKSYTFTGLQAHAALNPEKGRNALSAMEYMNIGVNYLRGQVTSDVRINYFVKQGGLASNIIADKTEVIYSIRGENLETVDHTAKLVDNIANCAAKAMRCTVEDKELMRLPNSIPNTVISKLAEENAKLIGPPEYTESMQKYVKDIGSSKGYLTEILEIPEEPVVINGSTDEASASWIAPWVRLALASVPQGIPAHTKNLAASANLDWAYRGVEKTIVLSVITILDLFEDQSILEKAKEELENSEMRVGNNTVNIKVTDNEFPKPSGFTLNDNKLDIELDKMEIFSELENSNIKVYSDENLVGEYALEDERKFTIDLDRDKIKDTLEVKIFDEKYWCTIGYLSNE